MLDVITAHDIRQWAAVVRALLAVHRAEIDRLNVYPVPDGDTGTNLYLTFDAALDAVVVDHERRGIAGRATVAQELTGMAQAMLLSARGNSGVILSQLVRGFADAATDHDVDAIDGPLLARAARAGSDRARAAVAHPVEGTILTVARMVAEAAERAAVDAPTDLAATSRAMLKAAEAALAETTEQLPTLRAAQVVDAGGAGYLLLVEGLHRVVAGEGAQTRIGDPSSPANRYRREAWGTPRQVIDAPTGVDGAPDGPAYEVMYLLRDTNGEQVANLTERLDALGDSLLVVGGPELWNVHVHVDDAGAAVEAGVESGVPYRIRITHFDSQVAQHSELAEVAVVACAAGPGIEALMRASGARTLSSGPGRRASTGQLLDAIRDAHARAVVLLPNDNDTIMAARGAAKAARGEGLVVHVVSSRTVVQGLAALAVFDPDAPADQNAVSMAEAAVATRHGAVTIAAREGLTSAGHCMPGDVLGVLGGDFAVIGHDLGEVAVDIAGQLLRGGGELVTLVAGADAPGDLSRSVAAAVARQHPRVEVVEYDGGQPLYPLLIGVE